MVGASPSQRHTHGLSGLGLSTQATGRAQNDESREPQATKARARHSPHDGARAHATLVVRNKEYMTTKRPRAHMALPHDKSLSFTIVRWLLLEEDIIDRPPP
jgi:hypothetical protein